MVQPIQTTRWKTFDGKDFGTRAEAEQYESLNVDAVIGKAEAVEVRGAIAGAGGFEPLAEAILKAANMIRKQRRDAAAPAAPPPET